MEDDDEVNAFCRTPVCFAKDGNAFSVLGVSIIVKFFH